MEHYLIDTNVISAYFSASLTETALAFMADVIDEVPTISVITQIELLAWKTDTDTESYIKDFISESNVVDISPEIVDFCVMLRRKHKIKTPDAIIAATALANKYNLITLNKGDFSNIKNLKIIVPERK
jgi:predicted nucleic acid-binding protein